VLVAFFFCLFPYAIFAERFDWTKYISTYCFDNIIVVYQKKFWLTQPWTQIDNAQEINLEPEDIFIIQKCTPKEITIVA